MGTICRKVCISGVPMVLCLIDGVAQDSRIFASTDRAPDEGRFCILHEDGQRTEIRLMKHLFTPRYGERVWVLLCKDTDDQRFGRHVFAGHWNDSVQAAARLISDAHWMELVSRLAPQTMTYWKERIAAATFVGMLAPILAVAPIVLLEPAAPLTLTRGAMIAAAIALVFIASRVASRFFTSRLARVMEGDLTPDIRAQMLEAAQMFREELDPQGVVR